ncbi:hypothetical protein M409DRAFT_24103 [Zasmidium cellare ATCC 36951]|uniref:Uncharacterized protein n=1 Tax=Zasmidium cellare ATCC 36951 TaxID=1080233 RepID=A0A6A6CK60_ZASCE|nr:uncharacterized protein M409DRAFT_24103 [Zasmidium cellare ATCC 36951]KAF2165816.1 hypothetical protein M409DRAFT_24103 [Zasmidium cellare ATCC 36951]
MPGSGKQSPQVQEQIKELLEAGFDPTTIHRRLKVGRSSIYRMKRCLQQHGTNYMPPELNKKNGRPKVLTPEQELEVHTWLVDPKNRTRYLDDLVWLIHDRFGIVCSTTTMSKMKRKWLRVIEYEENGVPIDDLTRSQLLETHPDLPLLRHDVNGSAGGLGQQQQQQHDGGGLGVDVGVDVGGVPQAQMLQAQEAMQAQMGAELDGVGVGVGFEDVDLSGTGVGGLRTV